MFPDRPPQYNERNCGYRCGEGCEKPCDEADGGGGSESDSDTAVDSISASDRVRTSPPLQEDVDGSSPISEQMRDGQLELSDSFEDYDELVEISSNENFSGTCSRATSGSRSAGTLSPMSPGPGIGRWAPEYYFLVTPLRLSPQYEHCRGHQSSHLVARDDHSSMDLA